MTERPGGGDATAIALAPGLLLLVATGFADSYTFLQHGHVFAEAMTGNLVLIAVGTFDPSIVQFWRPLLTYAAFLLGVAIAWSGLRAGGRHPRWRSAQATTLTAQVVVLAVVSVLPPTSPQIVVTMAIALVAGAQIAVFRTVGGHSFTSTVMTTNSFRAVIATLDARRSGRDADRDAARTVVLALTAFVLGGFAGAAASTQVGDVAAAIDAGLFAIVLAWTQLRPAAG